jgi:hypothetical protein
LAHRGYWLIFFLFCFIVINNKKMTCKIRVNIFESKDERLDGGLRRFLFGQLLCFNFTIPESGIKLFQLFGWFLFIFYLFFSSFLFDTSFFLPNILCNDMTLNGLMISLFNLETSSMQWRMDHCFVSHQFLWLLQRHPTGMFTASL